MELFIFSPMFNIARVVFESAPCISTLHVRFIEGFYWPPIAIKKGFVNHHGIREFMTSPNSTLPPAVVRPTPTFSIQRQAALESFATLALET